MSAKSASVVKSISDHEGSCILRILTLRILTYMYVPALLIEPWNVTYF